MDAVESVKRVAAELDKQLGELEEKKVLDCTWVMLRGRPLHWSVVCEDCGATPERLPVAGWYRQGTDPATWRHLCPRCAAARTPAWRVQAR